MAADGSQVVPKLLHLRPLAISAGARAALAGGKPACRTAHRHGVSLAVVGLDEEIFLGAAGQGLFPLHIVVRAVDLRRVLDALDALDSGAAGHVPLLLDVDAGAARVFRSSLAPDRAGMRSPCAQSNRVALARWLRAIPVPLGLGMLAAELLAPGGMAAQWLAALHAGRPQAEATLRLLIGRGAGATPAGDDLLIGMLAQAWATVGESSPLLAALRALNAQLPALTTTASVSYLRAAARGEFASHLALLVRQLGRVGGDRALALATRVASHGATSGLDTLAGFVAASEAADAARRAVALAVPARRRC